MITITFAFLILSIFALLLFFGYHYDNMFFVIGASIVSLIIGMMIFNGGIVYLAGTTAGPPCASNQTFEYGTNYTGEHLDAGSVPPGQPPIQVFHIRTTYTACTVTTTNVYQPFNLGFSQNYLAFFFIALFIFFFWQGVIGFMDVNPD